VWLRNVEESTGQRQEIEWKPFVLAQINSKEGPEWKAWEQPDDSKVRGMLALKAGLASMRQGRDPYDKFHLALVKARHEQRKELGDINVVLDCAREAGLDIERLQKDMKDPDILRTIAESHDEGVKKGVFGVPTFVFPNGQSAFLKMFYPDKEQSAEVYESLIKLMSSWINIGEIKRPQPPWPAGVQART
jgi:predicted DsbA family dithiol-disulfide isomerase